MPRLVWVTGAGGLIGSHIVAADAARCDDYRVRPILHRDLNLCDAAAVAKAFAAERPEVVIHCAAESKSTECERNPHHAWALNVEATAGLTHLAEASHFVFFSSDLVFDGRSGSYKESDQPNPLTVYGRTKAEAEKSVLANPRHTVIRTSLNAGPSPTGDRGFDEQLRQAWRRGDMTRLFTDESRSPIPAAVTAQVVWEIVKLGLTGLYHVAGSEKLSRFEIGELVSRGSRDLRPRIEPASLKDYVGPPRAPDTSLDCSKIQALLPFRIPGYREWLQCQGCA